MLRWWRRKRRRSKVFGGGGMFRRGRLRRGRLRRGMGGRGFRRRSFWGVVMLLSLLSSASLSSVKDHGCLSMDEGGVKEVERPFWSHRTRHGPAGVDRHVSSTLGAFVRVLIGTITVSAAAVGQTGRRAAAHHLARVGRGMTCCQISVASRAVRNASGCREAYFPA